MKKPMYYVLGAVAALASYGLYVWLRVKPEDDIFEDARVHRIRQLNRRGDVE